MSKVKKNQNPYNFSDTRTYTIRASVRHNQFSKICCVASLCLDAKRKSSESEFGGAKERWMYLNSLELK